MQRIGPSWGRFYSSNSQKTSGNMLEVGFYALRRHECIFWCIIKFNRMKILRRSTILIQNMLNINIHVPIGGGWAPGAQHNYIFLRNLRWNYWKWILISLMNQHSKPYALTVDTDPTPQSSNPIFRCYCHTFASRWLCVISARSLHSQKTHFAMQ